MRVNGKGVLLDRDENKIFSYEWGMGEAINNQEEQYTLFEGLGLIISLNISMRMVIWDSLLVITEARKSIKYNYEDLGHIQKRISDKLKYINEINIVYIWRRNNSRCICARYGKVVVLNLFFSCFKCLCSHPNTKDMDHINEGRTTHYLYTPFIGDDR